MGQEVQSEQKLQDILDEFDFERSSEELVLDFNRISTIFESEFEQHYKTDPDPFDDRFSTSDEQTNTLARCFRIIRDEPFIDDVVGVLDNGGQHEQSERHVAAARLLLNLIPGIEHVDIFEDNDTLLRRLYGWAEWADEPLRCYAVGLLAGAMEFASVTDACREQNLALVPIMQAYLRRLKEQQGGSIAPSHSTATLRRAESPDLRRSASLAALPPPPPDDDNASRSSWAEQMPLFVATYRLHPLEPPMQQRLILRYLITQAEFQEFFALMYADNTLGLIFHYIDHTRNTDVRLIFEALRYLAAMLCHKRFAAEFITQSGLQRLLRVPRPSLAAPGVALCLYYLAYFEEVMERVVTLPPPALADFVEWVSCRKELYGLWLLECSYESGQCHALWCFMYAFQFRAVLEIFDARDGLRHLFNVLFTLPIIADSAPDSPELSGDQVARCRQDVRHTAMALRRYFEAHLGMPCRGLTAPVMRRKRGTEATGRFAPRRDIVAGVKADELRQQQGGSKRDDIAAMSPASYHAAAYRATKLTGRETQANADCLLELLPFRSQWLSEVARLGGHAVLFRLLAHAVEWYGYSGRAETLCSLLECLSVLSLVPRLQLAFCDPPVVGASTPAITIVLSLCDPDVAHDPDVQKAALTLICNLVGGPMLRRGEMPVAYGRLAIPAAHHAIGSAEGVLRRVWDTFRDNNGIMLLLKCYLHHQLLFCTAPITEADSIRQLACRALVGLARSEPIRQVLSKLPLFKSMLINGLMKEPVLPDRLKTHRAFCSSAETLIEAVTGRVKGVSRDATLEQIRRAEIVSRTRIEYDKSELLTLIREHLAAEGFAETAGALQRELSARQHGAQGGSCVANLPSLLGTPAVSFARRTLQHTNPVNKSLTFDGSELMNESAASLDPTDPKTDSVLPNGLLDGSLKRRRAGGENTSPPPISAKRRNYSASPSKINSVCVNGDQSTPLLRPPPVVENNLSALNQASTPKNTRTLASIVAETSPSSAVNFAQLLTRRDQCSHRAPSFPPENLSPLRPALTAPLSLQRALPRIVPAKASLALQPATPQLTFTPARPQQVRDSLTPLRQADTPRPPDVTPQPPQKLPAIPEKTTLSVPSFDPVTLDGIMRDYLRNKHASCVHPVTTVPAFSLLRPHVCPTPRYRLAAPEHIVARSQLRQVVPRWGGPHGAFHDRSFVYSRFRPIRALRDPDEDSLLACCTFLPQPDNHLLIGTYNGDVKLFATDTGTELYSWSVGRSTVNHINSAKDGQSVLVCSAWNEPLSGLWRLDDDAAQGRTLRNVLAFNSDTYMEFGKLSEDRIVGTAEHVARVYDSTTGTLLVTLDAPEVANRYTANKATFSPTDQLVLSDGVLWDVRCAATLIHKFDKFNTHISGSFHPNGNEIIINSEVWDVRSYHLLHTVPALDQCRIRFNHTGHVLYGAIHQSDEDDDPASSYGSAFRTFDAANYTSIATVDVKKTIFDLCTDRHDSTLAVIENYRNPESLMDENFCRLYAVGMVRADDEDEEDEQPDEPDDDDDDDDDADDADEDAFDDHEEIFTTDEEDAEEGDTPPDGEEEDIDDVIEGEDDSDDVDFDAEDDESLSDEDSDSRWELSDAL